MRIKIARIVEGLVYVRDVMGRVGMMTIGRGDINVPPARDLEYVLVFYLKLKKFKKLKPHNYGYHL